MRFIQSSYVKFWDRRKNLVNNLDIVSQNVHKLFSKLSDASIFTNGIRGRMHKLEEYL